MGNWGDKGMELRATSFALFRRRQPPPPRAAMRVAAVATLATPGQVARLVLVGDDALGV